MLAEMFSGLPAKGKMKIGNLKAAKIVSVVEKLRFLA